MSQTIDIKDKNTLLHIEYEDLIKYHGREFIAGVAMAFKLLQLGFRELAHGETPSREKVKVLIGFEGPGLIDGIELVTRAKSRGALEVNQQAAPQDAPDAADGKGGRYYYEVSYGNKTLVVKLKDGLIPEEFVDLASRACGGGVSEAERARLQNLKEEIAAYLIANELDDLFDYSERSI